MFRKNFPYGQDPDEFLTFLSYGGKPLRMYSTHDMCWWVLADVCNLIDLGNPSRTAARLDDDEKMTLTLSNSHSGQRGGAQKLLLINEPGLYHLLLTSDKPEAKPFRHWIMFEVLPSIRRNGGYIMGQDCMDAGALSDAAANVAQNVLAARDQQTQDLRIQSAAQRALLREWEPKIRYADAVLQCPDAVPITVIAKDYGLSAQEMNRRLYDMGVQYPCGGTWVLYQRYAGKGYVRPETVLYGTSHCKQHTLWTQKGRMFLYEFLKAHGILPQSERMDHPGDTGGFWPP